MTPVAGRDFGGWVDAPPSHIVKLSPSGDKRYTGNSRPNEMYNSHGHGHGTSKYAFEGEKKGNNRPHSALARAGLGTFADPNLPFDIIRSAEHFKQSASDNRFIQYAANHENVSFYGVNNFNSDDIYHEFGL